MTNTLINSNAAGTEREFAAVGAVEAGRNIIRLFGELDLASREKFRQTLAHADEMLDVVVDLGELTFMDCAGYSSLITARAALTRHGGTLTFANAGGEPATLIAMISGIEQAAVRTSSTADAG